MKKRISQDALLEKINAANFPNVLKGACHGISAMGACAALKALDGYYVQEVYDFAPLSWFDDIIKQFASFDKDTWQNALNTAKQQESFLLSQEKSKLLQYLGINDVNILSQKEQVDFHHLIRKKVDELTSTYNEKILEMSIFLENIYLAQLDISAWDFIHQECRDQGTTQDLTNAIELIKPVTLNAKKIFCVATLINYYNLTKLNNYLLQLKTSIEKIHYFPHPLVFALSSIDHILLISYLMPLKKWILLDANFLPFKFFEGGNEKKLATALWLLLYGKTASKSNKIFLFTEILSLITLKTLDHTLEKNTYYYGKELLYADKNLNILKLPISGNNDKEVSQKIIEYYNIKDHFKSLDWLENHPFPPPENANHHISKDLLLFSISMNNLNYIQTFLSSLTIYTDNINCLSSNLLTGAILHGNPKILSLLLSHAYFIKILNDDIDQSYLYYAILNSNDSILTLMLPFYDLNHVTHQIIPLFAAIKNGKQSIIELLLKNTILTQEIIECAIRSTEILKPASREQTILLLKQYRIKLIHSSRIKHLSFFQTDNSNESMSAEELHTNQSVRL